MPRSSSRSGRSARSSGSGSMFSSSSRTAAPKRVAAPAAPPAPVHAAPASAPALAQPSGGGGMLSGLGSTIAQGFAFGTGSAIAHRAVGAVAGAFGGSDSAPAVAPEAANNTAPAALAQPRGADCSTFQRDFMQCVQQNKNDIAACQMYADNLEQCQLDSRLR